MYENAKAAYGPSTQLGEPDPKSQSQVASAFDRLDKETSTSGDLACELNSRLSLVLRSEPREDAEAKAVPTYSAELASLIGSQGNRVEYVNEVLRSILRRLEV